ncbi:hypothetical protein [Candidatus Tisiphia endosymbiont of Hybos culiciformis]
MHKRHCEECVSTTKQSIFGYFYGLLRRRLCPEKCVNFEIGYI